MSGAKPAADREISTAELMLAFESIGERCDFGAVQRKYGVEPLGLLRFGASKYDALLAALADRFAAIGSVEDTGFELYNDEIILIMKKYGLVFHTFVDQNELATEEKRDRFRQQQRRRLSFLRDKLIADLEEPEKIYVYSSDERVSDADVSRLFGALRVYGPNTLLYLRPATKTHPEGTVEPMGDGLYVGYFDRLVDFVGGSQPLVRALAAVVRAHLSVGAGLLALLTISLISTRWRSRRREGCSANISVRTWQSVICDAPVRILQKPLYNERTVAISRRRRR